MKHRAVSLQHWAWKPNITANQHHFPPLNKSSSPFSCKVMLKGKLCCQLFHAGRWLCTFASRDVTPRHRACAKKCLQQSNDVLTVWQMTSVHAGLPWSSRRPWPSSRKVVQTHAHTTRIGLLLCACESFDWYSNWARNHSLLFTALHTVI